MHRIIVLLVALVSVGMAGCSSSFKFYVRNHSSETYQINLYSNQKGFIGELSNDALVKNQVLEIRENTWKQLTDTVHAKKVSDTLLLQVPPSSTMRLPLYSAYAHLHSNLTVTLEAKGIDTGVRESVIIFPPDVTGRLKSVRGFMGRNWHLDLN